MASSRIGPEGGLLVVQGGQQDGLVLEIPPGVLGEPVEFRVLQGIAPIGSPDPTAVSPQLVGHPFVIEPAGMRLATECRLRVPYQPSSIDGTGPGNVVVHQISPTLTRLYAPDKVSVADGWFEVRVKSFGRFQAQVGERAASLADYTPPVDLVVPLTGGFEFVVDQEPSGSFFSVPETRQWRLTGPSFDESVIFLDGAVLGRRSMTLNWIEEWGDAYDPYQPPVTGLPMPQPMSMLLHAAGGAVTQGSIMAQGSYTWSEPIEFNGRLDLDVLRLTLNVGYSRTDIGAGERQMTWWLSSRNGLLRVAVDGQVYERLY